VEIMEPVLSAARTIPAGTVFKDGDFEVVNKNTVELNFSPMIRAASLTGRKASKVIQKGKIMGRQDIMETPDIATGSLVTITCGDEVMKLSTEGRAEEPGSAGDMIKVRNLKSKKIIMAKVVDNNTVEVGRQ
jgi:flagella basal body P-ring formation protein FlgA